MSCGGCNAIEYDRATEPDGRIVCATCPDRAEHGRLVPSERTLSALQRIEARAEKARRDSLQQRLKRPDADKVKTWWNE